jgi:hypothetical protein
MKVVCIDNFVGGNNPSISLTTNKQYEVIKERSEMYCVINDKGESNWYFKHRFIELKYFREKQIDSITNND